MQTESQRQSLSPIISLTWLAAHCAFFANRRVISRLRVDRYPPACSEQFPEPFPMDRTTASRYSELLPTVPSRLPHVWKNSNVSFTKKKSITFNKYNSFQIKWRNSLTRLALSSTGSEPPLAILHSCDWKLDEVYPEDSGATYIPFP